MLCQLDFPNKPFRQSPKTHYSSVPSFQHSNWGEAPKFSFLVNEIVLKNTYNLKLFFSKEIKVTG
jgi:hypothetical protein